MITTIQDLKQVIRIERNEYYSYRVKNQWQYYLGLILKRPEPMICRWQKYSRLFDFYSYKSTKGNQLWWKIWRRIFEFEKNRTALKLGFEIDTQNIGEGLIIYHCNVVINGMAHIGRNCHFHGMNCVGNSGDGTKECPIIGDGVMVGVGAKVIGNIRIADNIKIAAGAVVVNSFDEPGITIGGIPARKISK